MEKELGGCTTWHVACIGRLGMSTTTTDVTKVGTLVVDIFESPTKQLLWRGNASDNLTGNPEKNSAKLAKDVATMFKHFPPSN
jgi:hypothetical protein